MLALYVLRLMPLAKEKTEWESAYVTEQKTNQKLQQLLDDFENINQAYRLAFKGEMDRAVVLLEEQASLDKGTEDVLVEWYIQSNTVENLVKAAALRNGRQAEIVGKLIEKNSKEAKQVIYDMEADRSEVHIEKAWMEEEYENVVTLYINDLKDNERAKLLAAKSYLELDKPKEAIKLGEELNNKDIQITGLETEIELLKKNDSLDDGERDEKIEDLLEQIEDLE